jgi:peptidyl-dipeptidase A
VAVNVAPLLIDLVKLRNLAARSMGYRDYYEMELLLDEQKPEEVFAIFDELARLTDEPFSEIKREIDGKLSARWGIPPAGMRPWHYQDFFFQEPPDLGSVDLDAIFARHDVKTLIEGFYAGINLNVGPVLRSSDLYEREKKYQHAYCTDIDREGDVRTMCNLRNNEKWAGTLLHELGHGVYSFYHDRTMAWLLRDAAHTFTTEGVAQMFERCVTNPDWLVRVAGASPQEIEKVKGQLVFNARMGQLVFCRWSQVMVHFERELYRDPDQDLNKLWWDLVEKYQFVHRPENRTSPDWASKIHFTSSPVYYHNYLLGQLFASQLLNTMAVEVLKTGKGKDISFVDHPELGAFLISKVFAAGAEYRWDEMIRRATGEDLTPKYYVEDFVR